MSIFHDDDDARPRLPAAKSGGGLAVAFQLPTTPLLQQEHERSEAVVLRAQRYSGDEGDDRGAPGRSATCSPCCSRAPGRQTGSLGRRRPLRMT